MFRILKTLLILMPTAALAVAVVWFLTRSATSDPLPPSKLLVIVVFDQMRGDYHEKWATAYGPNGFERMKRDGVWYSNCHLPYACTATAPGHASLVTGAMPSVHGIIENAWYDRKAGKMATAFLDETRTPAMLVPTAMQAPSLSDSLKLATAGKGRFFSLSLKQRSAVFMGGKEPTNIFCFNNGEFHNSNYYSEPPAWVKKFNDSDEPRRFSGQTWSRVSTADYNALAGPDDVAAEYATVKTMPRPLPNASTGAEYYRALEESPFGNDLLWSFAKTAIEAEQLGNRNTTDVLALSFSSNDMIGHRFGPDSHEVLDVTLRSDLLVAEMIDYLDKTVGREHYTLIITADHGIAPLPEVAVKTHPEAARIRYSRLVEGLDEVLDETFGRVNGNPGRWVESDFKETKPWVYLNRRLMDALGAPYADVEAFAAKWLANRDGTLLTFTRTKLLENSCLPEQRPMFDAVRHAFHLDRSGDIYIVHKPYVQISTVLGVDHGSLHDYDRQVFVMALGANVPKLGKQAAPLNWLSITPMASKAMGCDPPGKSTKQMPEGW